MPCDTQARSHACLIGYQTLTQKFVSDRQHLTPIQSFNKTSLTPALQVR
jgi:hypothetical protein